jgi:hypothetical protein
MYLAHHEPESADVITIAIVAQELLACQLPDID